MKLTTRPSVGQYIGRLTWLAFFLLVVLPLYAIAVGACIRSGLFRFNGASFNNDQLKAIWTFLAAGLATGATVLGALLTKSHNDRTLAFQSESEHRQEVLAGETNDRLTLDAVTKVLNLIYMDEGYSPKGAIAGGLATLVQLGHPIVAMRVLAAVLRDTAVDYETAAWLISQVLKSQKTTGTPADLAASKEEAANLLVTYASNFTDSASDSGVSSWPDSVTAQWPTGLSRNAGINIVKASILLLVSQSKKWWSSGGYTYTWILYTFDEVVLRDPNSDVRLAAAILGLALLEVTDEDIISGIDDGRDKDKVAADMASVVDGDQRWAAVDPLREKILAWGKGQAAAGAPPSLPTPVSNPELRPSSPEQHP